MARATESAGDRGVATWAFLHDRLEPAFSVVERTIGADELDVHAPALLLYRRDLRIYSAGLASGLFIDPREEAIHEEPTRNSDSRSGRERIAEVARIVASGQLLPEEAVDSPTAVALGFSSEPLRASGNPQTSTRPVLSEVQDALARSMWLGVDSALLSFLSRTELLSSDEWREAIGDAQAAFEQFYSMCDCPCDPVEGGEEASDVDHWNLQERFVWLFVGVPRLLDAIDDSVIYDSTSGPLNPKRLRQALHTGQGRKGPAGPFRGIDALLSRPYIKDPTWQRLVDASRAVWASVRHVVPLRYQPDVFAHVGLWESTEARGLLTESAAPLPPSVSGSLPKVD